MDDSFRTIPGQATAELKIERSVFIGHCAPAGSEESARRFVAEIREAHRQATHNPFAYVVGFGPERAEYFHDHGEPGGTAGKPILGAIARLELVNTVVVVTRYFGGKKLGVRGLIEAYGQAATQALETAGPVIQIRTAELHLVLDYPAANQVLYILERHGANVLDRQFGGAVEIHASVALGRAEDLSRALAPHVRSIAARSTE